MRTNLGGKLNVSVELAGIGEVKGRNFKINGNKNKNQIFLSGMRL